MAVWYRAESLFRFVQARAPQTLQRILDERPLGVRTYFSDPILFHAGLKVRVSSSERDAMLALGTAFVTSADNGQYEGTPLPSTRR